MKYQVDNVTFYDFYFLGYPQSGLAGENNKKEFSWLKITKMIDPSMDESRLKMFGEELRQRFITRFNLESEWIVQITKQQYDSRKR